MSVSTVQNRSSHKVLDLVGLQISQVLELSWYRTPSNGRLRFFRMSLELDEARRSIHALYPVPLYANEGDIERLEQQLGDGDYVELVVQCCSVCEVYLRFQPHFSAYPRPNRGSTWIFDHVRTVGDIATLRHRLLRFERKSPQLEQALEKFTPEAVQRIISAYPPAWQELLMLFQTTTTVTAQRMLVLLDGSFEAAGTPKAALSLLLSYVAERVVYGHLFFSRPACKSMIQKLISAGASLMTSKNDHPALQEWIRNHLRLDQTPWWLEPGQPCDGREPTTLFRLMSLSLERSEIKQFVRSTCCSLDLNDKHARGSVVRSPSLRCLAAQKLTASQVEQLPLTMRHVASKHITVDVEEYFDKLEQRVYDVFPMNLQ